MNPSLGWIQAFMCVADHLDYALAGQDLGINANRAKQRIHKLEGWLEKVLFNDHPIQLTAGDGEAFVPIAWAVLQKAEAACPAQKDEPTADYFARRAAKISELHLDDLERFLSVAQQGSYKGAASILDCDVTTVQRSIQALEDITGSQLFSGRSILTLTDDGETFKDTAAYIAQALNDFRAVSSDHYDPNRAAIERLYRDTKIQQARLQAIASLISKTGKKQRGKVRLVDVTAELTNADQLLAGLIELHGPFDHLSGKDIVIGDTDIAVSSASE